MNKETVTTAIDAALDGRSLLTHDFYRRWEAGGLSAGELRSYAEQYRHFEAALPGVLRGILEGLPDGQARELIEENLADETGDPTHLELFSEFVDAVGGDHDAAPSPAMQSLLDTYGEVTSEGPASAIAGLVAYEYQAPGVAESKAEGLREHYGLDSSQTFFWDLHAKLDVDHADWAMEAMAGVASDSRQIHDAARRVADAWWSFLDERESLAVAA